MNSCTPEDFILVIILSSPQHTAQALDYITVRGLVNLCCIPFPNRIVPKSNTARNTHSVTRLLDERLRNVQLLVALFWNVWCPLFLVVVLAA